MIDKDIYQKRKIKVLLIEDSTEDIKAITDYIKNSARLDADVKTVDSIKKANTIMFYEEVDIILVDINVQGMKFDELIDSIDKNNLSIPYIVITDERDEDLGIEAVKKGAQDYLVRSELSERILRRAIIYSLERHEILENLYKTTIVDELTGLYNRRGLLTLGNQQVELAKRQNDDIFIFFLDLDGMKIINDTLGHEFGDKALVDTSKVMHKSFRTTDILSRIGGDEFVVVAVKAQYEFIPIIIDRVKDFVKQANEENEKFELSMSIGVSKVNLDAESPLEDAIRDADKKMYDAKLKNKKNRS